MIRKEVVSSFIKSIGHNGDTLEVEFKSGKVYEYFPVISMIYDDFMKADSKSKFFRARIVDSYTEREVSQRKL